MLFAVVLLLVAAGVGLLAAYEHGYFEKAPQEAQGDIADTGVEGAAKDSPGASRPAAGQARERTDVLYQPTLLKDSEANQGIYDSLTESERESLQRIADAVDATLKGKRDRGPLTDDDLQVAEKYSRLINPARWREFWYRTAARTAGFPEFKRLRDRGDADDFKSAAVAWIRLDGYTRGTVLEALKAIAEEDEILLDAHAETIEQYPFILGNDIPGIEQPEKPLRAPRP